MKTSAILAVLAALALPVSAIAGTESQQGDALIILEPVTLETHPMQQLLPNARGCAVRLRQGIGDPQDIVTVGAGESEMLSCVKFVEAAELPLEVPSIGLIYTFESGPNSSFDAAVILSRDPVSGEWYRNEDYEGDLTVNSAFDTINALTQEIINRGQ